MENSVNPTLLIPSLFSATMFSDIFRRTRPAELEKKLKSSVFKSLSMQDIVRLCRIAEKGRCQFSDTLLHAGEQNEKLYLVTEGSCLIKVGGKFFAEVEEGHFLGEMSHFSCKPVSANVVSRGDLHYLCWDRASLDRLFARRPVLKSQFYNILLAHMASRLQIATEKMLSL